MALPRRDEGSPVRQGTIVAALRRQIVEGLVAPGSQLPTRQLLQEQFGVSTATLQKALDTLVADGFVTARGPKGTYVSETPPHLSHYGLVLPMRPHQADWPQFWTALCNEAVGLQRSGRRNISIYYEINSRQAGDDYQRLVRDVRRQRLAGLLFVQAPEDLVRTPIMDEPDLPRVAVMGRAAMAGVTALELNGPDLAGKAMTYFQSRGRSRVAVMLRSDTRMIVADQFRSAASSRGLGLQLAPVDFRYPYWAQEIMALVLGVDRATRPDAVLIADDNLVEHATMALQRTDLRIGQDLDVLAHCNFPWPTRSMVPVRRIGYDARRVLDTAVECINAYRRGESLPWYISVAATMEDEIRSS